MTVDNKKIDELENRIAAIERQLSIVSRSRMELEKQMKAHAGEINYIKKSLGDEIDRGRKLEKLTSELKKITKRLGKEDGALRNFINTMSKRIANLETYVKTISRRKEL